MDAPARARLLRWYRRNSRDLPWRRARDPYAIWVSEVMLQQTRVNVAIPYFQRWMRRFPTVTDLAQASLDDVLRLWSGLGYYTRARNLHQAAQAVVRDHGAALPRTVAALRRLPGVGEYTAGAIASIAFGERVPAIDGNVVRVTCRLAGIRADPRGAVARRRIRESAASWVPTGSAGDWNQALMELGATLCTPRSPRCGACPVAASCEARRLGLAHAIPPPRRRKAPRAEAMEFAAVVAGGRVLLVRNPEGMLQGLWSLPGGEAGPTSAAHLRRLVRTQTGVDVRLSGEASTASHAFSHRAWSMRVRRATVAAPSGTAKRAADPARKPSGTLDARWMRLSELPGAALSSAMRKALAAVGLLDLAPPEA